MARCCTMIEPYRYIEATHDRLDSFNEANALSRHLSHWPCLTGTEEYWGLARKRHVSFYGFLIGIWGNTHVYAKQHTFSLIRQNILFCWCSHRAVKLWAIYTFGCIFGSGIASFLVSWFMGDVTVSKRMLLTKINWGEVCACCSSWGE